MDLRLVLLLMCVCRDGVTNVTINLADNDSIPLVPLIPLIPSHSIENKTENNTTQPPSNLPVIASTITETNRSLSEEQDPDQIYNCVSVGQSTHAIANAIQKIGIQLLQNLEISPEKPNVIISPLSISLALSQLALGAANKTEELLMNHLHAKTLPCYHDTLREVLQQLKKSDLQIATRMFLQQGFEPKEDFVHQSRRLYNSEPVVLEGLQQINAWVEKETNGIMKGFLPSLPPNVLLMLINAVYFKGEWKTRFDPHLTSQGVFYINESHMVNVEMMEAPKYLLSQFIDHELNSQVARFQFKKFLSFLVVMPMSGKFNVTALSAKLNISDLYDRMPKEKAAQVKVPKFKLEYTRELKDVFKNLGLEDIFSKPDLAKISDGPLLVSSVMHKSSMEISEEGAEAAATTAVVISRASSPMVFLQQPFFLALVDDMTQVPIFMGVITNPNPGAPILEQEGHDQKDKFVDPLDKNYVSSSGGSPK